MRRNSRADEVFGLLGRALSTVAGAPQTAQRPLASVLRPQPIGALAGLTPADQKSAERAESIALMRINHVGEVCAQALYEGQALATSNPALKAEFRQVALEEADHLSWTAQRLSELGGRPSLLNPLWYAGSLAMGLLASRSGDALSLGFMAETERQVEHHLDRHLKLLPAADTRSRAILLAMRDDEIAHGARAVAAGGQTMPRPVQWSMRLVSRVMTGTARYL
jgi:3-demethoxyubiquinol 3-hydroxylase